MMMKDLEKRMVSIGDSPAYPALVRTDTRWNGWAIPLFSRATALCVLDEFKCGHHAELEGHADIPQEDRWFTVEPIEIDGETGLWYGIGAMAWCWDDPEEDQVPPP